MGLWAVSVAKKATTYQYTYGWQRAEILGAFFNAVFLIALCVSIILEALSRFIDPPEISNPKLILIVGSLGLASNLAGFVVLGGHGHSHGPGEHGHGEGEHTHADGHAHGHTHEHNDLTGAEEGRAGFARHGSSDATETTLRHISFDHDSTPSASIERSGSRASRGRDRRTPGGSRHGRFTSIEDISIHPASFRQDIMDACQPHPEEESSSESSIDDENAVEDNTQPIENTPLLGGQAVKAYGSRSTSKRSRRNSGIHDSHIHNKPKGASTKSHGHGHSHGHGDMGMDGMILHVIGDALGNVGVIVTALIIWLTTWEGRFYADPAVSLFITLIILRSAIPLTMTTSKVLLQATPNGINADEVKQDIESLPGVEACHDVHIWQLSDTTIVASMHVRVKFPVSEKNGEKFMELSRRARKCFHAYGIHSATIQPEFWTGGLIGEYESGAALRLDGSAPSEASGGQPGNVCLLECVDDCTAQSCCAVTKPRPGSSRSGSSHAGSHHSHDHSGGETHSHH